MTNEDRKNWYIERKAQGICIWCGLPAVPGKTLCESCLKEARDRINKNRLPIPSKWPTGYCYICCEAAPGRKLCKKHEHYFDNTK